MFTSGVDHQGCCVLDKALGMLELLWAVDKCHKYEARTETIGSSGAFHNEIRPCYNNAAQQLLADVRSCCRITASYTSKAKDLSAASLFDAKLAPTCSGEARGPSHSAPAIAPRRPSMRSTG